MSKSDLYQSVTDRIIAALQAGTPPWVCPWAPGPGLAAPATWVLGDLAAMRFEVFSMAA